MTNMQRVKKILLGLLMIACSLVLIHFPKDGFFIVALIVCFTLIGYGVRMLIYYFSMARHMVGGLPILWIGVIALDFGVFTLTTADDPRIFTVIYLLGVHAFSGAMEIMRAFEARRLGSPAWKWSLAEGFVNLTVAVLAVIAGFFLRSQEDLSYLYAASLLFSACEQIVGAFRKTAIVYIQ